MDITILIPHYRTGKMTAFTIAQILKHKGDHNVDIVVIDNNPFDGSADYLIPFHPEIEYYQYPEGQIQSHAVAYDWALKMGFVTTEYFITLESDSFPVREGWLDYYQLFMDHKYDIAGSLLQLSGGKYIHPAGALYKTELWNEAREYCNSIPYKYLSNYGRYNDFDCHVMVHNNVWEYFLSNPMAFVNLPESKVGVTSKEIFDNYKYYRPIVGPFHNGMGRVHETLGMVGARNPVSDPQQILLDGTDKIIHRIGYEPGQWLTYWAIANGKKICEIPTKTIWMPNRENQQQEYTLTENGVKHLWGVSSFAFSDKEDIRDIAVRKRNLPEELYETLPEEYKVKKLPQ